MNVITKSGNLASYFRVTTQLVGSSAKCTAPMIPAHETKFPKSMDVVQSSLNNALTAQTALIGGKSHWKTICKTQLNAMAKRLTSQ